MSKEVYAARRERVRRKMHERGLSGLLVTLDANRYYLSGFELHDAQINESSGRLVITADGKDKLCTDARFYDTAKRLWPEEDIFIYQGPAASQINRNLHEWCPGAIGFEARTISVAFFEDVSQNLSMHPADGLIESLRAIKDSEEIRRMRASCTLNHKLMHQLSGMLTPGKTEMQAAWEIEQFFRNNGAEELAFASIVAVDANAALPHAVPSRTQITENSVVLVDVGCRVDGYCSDQTRTLWIGDTPQPWYTLHYERIREAQQKAIQAIRPGSNAADIYTIAKAHLDSHGLGHLFTHGLGHGVGLQTHEGPSLNPKSATVLEAGMIVTVEPGLYVNGQGGVRYEHMVLVTDDGYDIL